MFTGPVGPVKIFCSWPEALGFHCYAPVSYLEDNTLIIICLQSKALNARESRKYL